MTQNGDWTAVPQRKGGGDEILKRITHMRKHIIYLSHVFIYLFISLPPALCQCCVMNSHHGLRNPPPIPQTTHRSHSQLSVTWYISFSYILKQMKALCQHAMYHFKSHLNNFDCPALILGWFACPYHRIPTSPRGPWEVIMVTVERRQWSLVMSESL